MLGGALEARLDGSQLIVVVQAIDRLVCAFDSEFDVNAVTAHPGDDTRNHPMLTYHRGTTSMRPQPCRSQMPPCSASRASAEKSPV
jgi:hypothetical protein